MMCGNGCEHDPRHLRPYQRDPDWKDPHPVIAKVKARIEELARRPGACPQIFFHPPKTPDKRPRQERSEGRERDAAFLSSMFDHMDIVTLRVGVPRPDGTFYRYSVPDLAKGCPNGDREVNGERRVGRYHRASTRLKRLGIVKSKRRSGKNNRSRGPINLRSSRTIPRATLRVIGMEREFMHERELEWQRRQNGGLTAEERNEAVGNATPPAAATRRQRPAAVEAYFAARKRPDPKPP